MDYDYLAIFRAAYRNDPANLEPALKQMKIYGASRELCIQVLVSELGLALNEAFRKVQGLVS